MGAIAVTNMLPALRNGRAIHGVEPSEVLDPWTGRIGSNDLSAGAVDEDPGDFYCAPADFYPDWLDDLYLFGGIRYFDLELDNPYELGVRHGAHGFYDDPYRFGVDLDYYPFYDDDEW